MNSVKLVHVFLHLMEDLSQNCFCIVTVYYMTPRQTKVFLASVKFIYSIQRFDRQLM